MALCSQCGEKKEIGMDGLCIDCQHEKREKTELNQQGAATGASAGSKRDIDLNTLFQKVSEAENHLRIIKGCIIFFTVLTALGIVLGFFL